MRLMHLADLHIGKRVNEYPMLDDQRYVLERVVTLVGQHKVDAVLIAGDLYDKSAPSAEAVALVDWFLTALAHTGAQVLVCAGNHDSDERVAYGRELLAGMGVHLSSVYRGQVAHVELTDEHGPVTFWLIPFLKPAQVRAWLLNGAGQGQEGDEKGAGDKAQGTGALDAASAGNAEGGSTDADAPSAQDAPAGADPCRASGVAASGVPSTADAPASTDAPAASSGVTTALSYSDALQAVVASLPLDPSQRNVALSHQFVTAGSWLPDTCESEMSVGGSDNVDVSVYDPFDYVALGHLHRPQRVGRDTVRYSGSLLKYSLSEHMGRKSIPIVDLGPKGQVSVELIDMPYLHDLRRVKGTLAEVLDPDKLAQADCEDYVYAVLTDEVPPADAQQRLRAAFPNLMSLAFDNAHTRHEGTADDCDLEQAASLSPLELFYAFWQGQMGCELDDEDRAAVEAAFEKAQVM